MDIKNIETIGIIGAGVMGRGIALVVAKAGFSTILYDINPEILDSAKSYGESFFTKSIERGKMNEEEKVAALARIKYTSSLDDLKADFVIEAILENLEIKQKVLGEVEEKNPGVLLASNTSTLPITRIGASLKHPERLVGMHFFNPAPIMKLVEVISGEMTDPALAQLTEELAKAMGKTTVKAKDEPGFIVNRVARQFYVESLNVLEENVASHETIDRLIKNIGFRMGPFQLMDLIGIETNHEVTKSMFHAFFQDEKFRPSRIQQKKVDAGHFGKKTGKGFYDYKE